MYIHYIALNSIHDSSFVMDRPSGRIDFLFLYLKTPCTFVAGNQVYTVTSPSAVLLDSNTPHKYFPTGTSYIDDYLHFAPDEREAFLKELTFPLNIPLPVSNDSFIQDILRLIEKEFNPENKNSSKVFTLLIKILMIKVGDEWNQYQKQTVNIPHYDDLLTVRNQILNSPEKNWKIEELAGLAHLSHAYFQVMYKKAFGITCITDVINAKIAQAKILLTSTELPVKQIAQELGYNEVYHFIRQFKKTTGITPGAFRKK
ncbi:helix-turn-helix transcriptional regulator [Anaerocolumna sp. MB42-C2]|uniref:helix-turn-helix transcriptional regulator n=1 Tax=Anaerocolumna sp. MB42-C2 TaxID=3070997 RepID=UPI0027E1F1EF|nr:AraC family transcriptional regulator [Anaerocolumna sp. MB42-C2]WMJ86595.1 AraC family transcriptional regulator [Anaerocolumna sp. MB42-C2]